MPIYLLQLANKYIFNKQMKQQEWKTKEEFNLVDWVNYRNGFYTSKFDPKVCEWYYKFI